MSTSFSKFAILAAGTLLCNGAQATEYKLTMLGTLGGANSYASAINNAGQVVGYAQTTQFFQHATIWNGGVATDLNVAAGAGSAFISEANAINDTGLVVGDAAGQATRATAWSGQQQTDLGTLGGLTSLALGANDAGQIVGQASVSGGLGHATLWNGTAMTDLGTPGGNYSVAWSINNSGQIVGLSGNSGADPHATLWHGGASTDLGTLGGNYSVARSINDAGQIVGSSDTADGKTHAALWQDGAAIDLGTLGWANSGAFDINGAGQAVGLIATNGYTLYHAVLWDGATTIDLNSFLDADSVNAGWVLARAFGINDQGWIVGSAENSTLGVTRAFLLAPAVPEPATCAMTLLGLGLLGAAVRCNQQARNS